MLYEIMKRINNFFIVKSFKGTWAIEGGKIALPFVQTNQYILIQGSIFNDGVYKYTDDLVLENETFDGVISGLAVPKSFLALADEIMEWQSKNKDIITSPYSSETFDGYSYSMASGNSVENGSKSWYKAFSDRLAMYRKV
uniref:Uncharacterized protein n=1 Tax=Siphoviridae sp. ctljn1 TaxID=2826448 RepID=A0A8S5R1G7_9CAUD|nr:MAG TPA: hypothetical protein [Siphoviridae sp. ctljn1]